MREAWDALQGIRKTKRGLHKAKADALATMANGSVWHAKPKEPAWYVVQVGVGREQLIASEMEGAGLTARVLKRLEERRRHCKGGGTKRTRLIEVSYFPGYLFVRCIPSNDAWHRIMEFDHVMGITGANDTPALMTDVRMDALVLFVERIAKDSSTGEWKIKPRDQVEILQGPFAYFQGVVDKNYDGAPVVPVYVEIFGRETRCNIGVDELQKLA